MKKFFFLKFVNSLLDEFTFQRIADKKYEYKNEGFVGG